MSSILNATEQAIYTAVTSSLTGIPNISVYVSDLSEVKDPMPYVIIRAKDYSEIIAPGCGIFKVDVSLIFRSHVKDTSSEDRETIIESLNNFAYSTPATVLSQATGFHCYGFIPTTGRMTVDGELKAYVYEMDFELHCMPRDNS